MSRSKLSIHRPLRKRGRPPKARIDDSSRNEIKSEIESAYNSLPEFYREAFVEAGESGYRGFKQPSDVETVKSAFVHFFSGTRPLPKLYWKVLENLLSISDGTSQCLPRTSTGSRKIPRPVLPESPRQLAYTFFMEITNRKVALSIDWNNDTLSDVYISWKTFFDNSVSLLKNFPVEHAADARPVIKLIQEVLHEVLRPHLTRWQAAYRRWYETNSEGKRFRKLPPQEIQKHFPQFAALRSDFEATQTRVSGYVRKLERLIFPKE